MIGYKNTDKLLAAVDCIIFGFDGLTLRLLLIHRGFEPEIGKWSLIGGFISKEENAEQAAIRILKKSTGLEGVYLEQLHTFSNPDRDPVERTVSIAYFALIDIHQYEKQITDEYHAEWVPLSKIPKLIFDHRQMVDMAKDRLKYKAALHPILFELLPPKFTLPQLQNLYEGIYGTQLDKRNFSRKILSTGLLVKQKDKEKQNSKKGAYYYKLDKKRYNAKFQSFLNFIPNAHKLI
jgi:ADP-ribose pyrophosphatase YjhB (NUDIX family)